MTTALRRFWRAPGRDPILPDGRHVPDAGMVFADTTWVLRRLRDGAITHDAPAQPEPVAAVQDTPAPAETAPTAMSPTPSAKRVRSAAPAANADATPAPEAATPPAGPGAPEPEPAADPAHEE